MSGVVDFSTRVRRRGQEQGKGLSGDHGSSKTGSWDLADLFRAKNF